MQAIAKESTQNRIDGCLLPMRPNLKDEDDDRLLEVAIAGNARAIVTHNLKDFRNTELLFPQLAILAPNNS
ncbi:MAG: PIN domain-containing protein [Cyanobacteria bacterium P01_D01_bin.123]